MPLMAPFYIFTSTLTFYVFIDAKEQRRENGASSVMERSKSRGTKKNGHGREWWRGCCNSSVASRIKKTKTEQPQKNEERMKWGKVAMT
mmetsp:Transcript_18927/g.32572  ORF Transcript_18927/g.32572 Transcript_18927/m.32572 type:complete len:89 (-) Transcript_18927:192-458(-)